ncbi:tetratricopeptide repeat protein 12 [Drosophila innubila]|uniref:tetratricopeptide repeat protein 12 n=1 Tax=Drosophila innubila TaxID=198719 RepID=UPI00148C1C41|nr:tetratricopeptide repeat protein 12 [Drosophila innubila]
MSTTKHSELNENFLRQPSKVDDIIKFLAEMAKSNKMEGTKEPEVKKEVDISASVTDSSFLVTQRSSSSGKRSKSTSKKPNLRANMNQMTFMRQIDLTDEERIKAREERVRVANNFRRLGNAEYRRTNFDSAIEYYTKGLNYINDSPVLFVNRSLCYIKKREYKRALIDLNHVLNNLDSCCLRAWLYKAGTLKRMNNDAGYEECVDNARRYNRRHLDYVEYFLDKMRSDF